MQKDFSFFYCTYFFNFKVWKILVHALYLYCEDVVKKACISVAVKS